VLSIHASKDIKATESQLANEFQKDPAKWWTIHQGLEQVLNGDKAKNDPQLAASIYRDLAVMDQAAARSLLDKDKCAAAIMLDNNHDSFNAKNAITAAESQDPANKDLPQLHLIQDDLAHTIWPTGNAPTSNAPQADLNRGKPWRAIWGEVDKTPTINDVMFNITRRAEGVNLPACFVPY